VSTFWVSHKMCNLDIGHRMSSYDAAAACVKPYAVTMAIEALEGTGVKVCPVIGFPAGNSTIAVKVFEATEVVKEVRRFTMFSCFLLKSPLGCPGG
jgi:deoxyribose-phosphate aldolase